MQKASSSISSRKICWPDGFRTVDPAAPHRSNVIRKEKDLQRSSLLRPTTYASRLANRLPKWTLPPSRTSPPSSASPSCLDYYRYVHSPVRPSPRSLLTSTVIVDARAADSCLFVDRLTVLMVGYLTWMVWFINLLSLCEKCWLIIF